MPPPLSWLLRLSLVIPAVASAGGRIATSAWTPPATFDGLTWIAGSSNKVEQIIGDHDWADTTRATVSRTVTNADVLGNGLGYSFVSGDSVIFLFGDTIGASAQ
jgi:hypothetical protein